MDFEQAEQTRRLVVVTALNALLQGEENVGQRAILKNKLRAYAFPEEIFESPAEIKAYHYCGDDDCKGDCDDL